MEGRIIKENVSLNSRKLKRFVKGYNNIKGQSLGYIFGI